MATSLKKISGSPIPRLEHEERKEFPHVTFSVKDIPEIKDWKVGGKYKLEIAVEQVSAEKNRFGFNEKQPLTATFKVVAVKALEASNPKKELPSSDGKVFV